MFRIERKVNDGAWALLVETEDLFYEDSDISLPNTYYYRSKHVDEEVWSNIVTISPSGYIVEVSHNEGAYTELTQVLTHKVVDTDVTELTATLREDNSVLLELPTYWPDALGYIYNEGEHEDMWVEATGEAQGEGSITKQIDHFYVRTYSSPQPAIRAFVTDVLVDLTSYSSLSIDWSASSSGAEKSSFISVSTEKTYRSFYAELSVAHPNFSRRIDTLDISAITGSFYLHVGTISDSMYMEITEAEVNVYKVWLE